MPAIGSQVDWPVPGEQVLVSDIEDPEKGLGDRPAVDSDRRSIARRLESASTVFRLAEVQGPLVAALDGDLDSKPALDLLRCRPGQPDLALSEDPRVRAHRIPEEEVLARVRAEPVRRFLDRPDR